MATQRSGLNRPVTRRRTSVFREFCCRLGSILDPLDDSGLRATIETGDTSKLRALQPGAFTCPDSYRRSYLLHEVARKFPNFPGDSQIREDATLSLFRKAEAQCLETNVRLSGPQAAYRFNGIAAATIEHMARRKIESLLGVCDLSEIARGFGFGPGASTRLPRRRADAWYKFQGNPETTANNAIFADAIFSHLPLWKERAETTAESGDLYKVVPGNRVVSVPKNAKVNRLIAIEPDLNLFVQKGFGKAIRRRLKRVGVDLDDQKPNQLLAELASLNGELATIDLSMASDTLAEMLVRLLLPPDWYTYMSQCRSQKGVLSSGEEVLYRKFSSMGNGYTFELESLIFWAICSSVVDLCSGGKTVCVYGDDIIVPSDCAPTLILVLNHYGFSVNERKSFLEGPFRESCGKHFFLGTDVSPFYVDDDVVTDLDIVLLANQIARWSCRTSLQGRYFPHRSRELKPIYDWLVSLLPCWYQKPRIPNGYGDGALIGDWDEVSPDGFRRQQDSRPGSVNQLEGYLVRTTINLPVSREVDGWGSLLKSLWCLSKASDVDAPPYRDPTLTSPKGGLGAGFLQVAEKHKKGKILVHRWPHMGPWF